MESKIFRPKVLKKGDKVFLTAPSSPVYDFTRVDFAAGYLENMGFVVEEGASCRTSYGYLAGDDDLRADDINYAFASKDIDGIFCLRGGYGAARLLEKIDYSMIKSNPKFFCGYSDITALHTAINQCAGLMTFHTPVVGEANFSAADAYTICHMNRYISNDDVFGKLFNPPGHDWKFINPGKATGILTGGNLSVLASLVGTAYEIDTVDKIVFIEEVGEKPYRIDRMLNQLKMAGKFENCSGVVFGDFTDCNPVDERRSLTILQIIHNLKLGVPALYNFRCGHCLPTASLPMGATARLCSAENCFSII